MTPTAQNQQAMRLSIALQSARVPESIYLMQAIGALGTDGYAAVPTLLAIASRDRNDSERVAALSAIGLTGVAGDVVVPPLAQLLRVEPSEEVRMAAILAITAFPDHVALAANEIIHTATDDISPVGNLRRTAFRAAQMCGPALLPHLDVLLALAATHDGYADTQAQAIACLATTLPAPHHRTSEVLHCLLGVVRTGEHSVALEAIEALRNAGVHAEQVARELVEIVLENPRAEFAPDLLKVLGGFGLSAQSVAPKLIALGEHHVHLAVASAIALASIDPASVPLVIPGPRRTVRDLGCRVHEAGLLFVPVLEAVLEHASESHSAELFRWALETLAELGAIESIGRWIGRVPSWVQLDQVPLGPIESAIFRGEVNADSLLAIGRCLPELRGVVVARLARMPQIDDSTIPLLLSWLTIPVVQREVAQVLTLASTTRPWLQKLLLERLAMLPADGDARFADALGAGLSDAMIADPRRAVAI